jgi:hypothetical protein
LESALLGAIVAKAMIASGNIVVAVRLQNESFMIANSSDHKKDQLAASVSLLSSTSDETADIW